MRHDVLNTVQIPKEIQTAVGAAAPISAPQFAERSIQLRFDQEWLKHPDGIVRYMAFLKSTISANPNLIEGGKAPSVYWHGRVKQWTAKIGFNLLPFAKSIPVPGRRKRATQYYGNDQSSSGKEQAIKLAVFDKLVWKWIVVIWPDVLRPWLDWAAREYNWSKPVWFDSPFVAQTFHLKVQKYFETIDKQKKQVVEFDSQMHQRHAELLEALQATSPGERKMSLEPYVPLQGDTTIGDTIQQVAQRFLESRKARVSLKKKAGLKANTFNDEVRRMRLALTAFDKCETLKKAGGTARPIKTLMKRDLEAFKNYWFAEGNGLSERTAKNYCTTFYSMLRWAASEEDLDFVMPKGAEKIFRFGRVDGINIVQYDPAVLIRIRRQSDSESYLYQLLGLLGMYQGDIAHWRFGEVKDNRLRYYDTKGAIKGEIVRLEKGKPVPLTYEEIKKYKGGDIYIHRLRDRTEHKVETKSLIWLFPEAGRLLAKHLAPKDNPYSYCLLDSAGKPLMQSEVGVSRHDVIGPAFSRIIAACKDEIRREAKEAGLSDEEADSKAADFRFSFKQYRKVGATAVSNLAATDSATIVRLYRSQPPDGDAKYYVEDDFEKKLTPVLKTWAKTLRKDKVLVDDPSK